MTAPVHPVLVHFTVALTFAAYAFDLLAFFLKAQSLMQVGWWDLAAALVATFGTIATGVRSRLRLPMEEGFARGFLRGHMALGPMVLGLLLVMSFWRATFWRLGAPVSGIYLVVLTAVLVLLAVQAYLGGELVYRYAAEVHACYRPLPEADVTRPHALSSPQRSTPEA